jgi:hypothetical protein
MSDPNPTGPTTEEILREMAAKLAKLEAENAAMKTIAGNSDALAQHLRNESAYKRDAWKEDFDEAQTFYAEVNARLGEAKAKGEDPWAPVKKEFADQAKAKQLGPLDVLILTYLIFGKEESHFKLAHAWLEATGAHEKVAAHNWLVLGDLGDHRRRQLGPHIGKLAYPLFPENVGKEFSCLNQAFLREAGALGTQRLFGKGPGQEEEKRKRPNTFLEDDGFGHLFRDTPAHEERVISGAGYKVRVGSDGFVDLSGADAAMTDAQNRISALELALQNAGVEVPPLASGWRGGRGGRGRGGRGRGSPNL